MATKELKGDGTDQTPKTARRAPQGTRLGGTDAPVAPAAPTARMVLKTCAKCTAVLSAPEDAKFCPSCGGNLMATTAQVVPELAPVAPSPIFTATAPVQQQPAAMAPPAPVAAISSAPVPIAAREKHRKGARTLIGEAETEGQRFVRFLLVMGLAALVAGIIWLITSHRRSQPDPLPVSTMPISVMPYDAGTD